MASSSEVTIGARVTNAEKILTHLQAFTGYAPADATISITALSTLIASTKQKNTEAASAIQGYSEAVGKRQSLFKTDLNSLIKIQTPIVAAIRSSFGKSSKQAADITAIITKIRGIKVKKPTNDPKADFVSQSERSYGSMTQNFSDIITTLENYGVKYNPANTDIKIPTLKQKLLQLTESNISVTANYGKLKEKRDDRAILYKELTTITQRIKDAVKSQYGQKSTEYNLIKSIKV